MSFCTLLHLVLNLVALLPVSVRSLYSSMKNTFQAIFDTNFSYEFAVENIDNWIEHAKMLNNKYLTKFIELFERHRTNILNYFHNRIASAAVEGKNNLLRTIKRAILSICLTSLISNVEFWLLINNLQKLSKNQWVHYHWS